MKSLKYISISKKYFIIFYSFVLIFKVRISELINLIFGINFDIFSKTITVCVALASSRDKNGNFYVEKVIGVEKNTQEGRKKIQKINKGELPINSSDHKFTIYN